MQILVGYALIILCFFVLILAIRKKIGEENGKFLKKDLERYILENTYATNERKKIFRVHKPKING